MENFTPISALIGGLLIGGAATLTLWANGRIAGISGILSGVIVPGSSDRIWRILFVLGMLAGAIVYAVIRGAPADLELQVGPAGAIIAGLLVGFGTRLGSGCTSGHGICGLARFSRRSFTATLVFMATAILTVFVIRHVIGVAA